MSVSTFVHKKEESEVVSLVETMVSKTNIRLLWTSLNKQKGADHETYCYGEDEEGWETRCHGERLRNSLLGTCTYLSGGKTDLSVRSGHV